MSDTVSRFEYEKLRNHVVRLQLNEIDLVRRLARYDAALHMACAALNDLQAASCDVVPNRSFLGFLAAAEAEIQAEAGT